jgi:Domain of unknown function (DUF4185)
MMHRSVVVAGSSAVVIAVAVAAWAVFIPAQVRIDSTKVCQVTGIGDRQHPDRPTGTMLTGRTGGVTGTDLGFPFEYKGELVMLFGDSREFDPDRCEPAWCGAQDGVMNPPADPGERSKHPADDPQKRLKLWPTLATWNTWVAHRTEGADSIARAPLDFDPEGCIPVSFETDERGSVYVHELADGRVEAPFRLQGDPVASRPEDRWVVTAGDRILVITQAGEVFAHELDLAGKTVGRPFRLAGPRVAARPEDKWLVAMGGRLLVGTADGRVFAHPVLPNAIGPAIELSGARVAARAEDKWVLVGGNRLLVVTHDGRVFAHALAGNAIGAPFQLGGPRVAANPQDKWVIAMERQLLVITRDGELFVHPLVGDDVGVATVWDRPWPFVGANPQDRRALAMGERLLILTQHDGLFRPTTLDGYVVGRDEGAIGAVTDDATIYAFFTMQHAGHAHNKPEPGGKTVLAKSLDDGRSFRTSTTTSTIGKFLWTVPVLATADIPGLPEHMSRDSNAKIVLMWGAGRQDPQGRVTLFGHSYPYLAVAPLSTLEDLASWLYYAGSDASGAPQWLPGESTAQPVAPFGKSSLDRGDGPGYHECLGYFSVRRMEAWGRWVMMYTCNADKGNNPHNGTRGIYMRTAEAPWGPWSRPQLAFDPKIGSGYCEFMYFPLEKCPRGSPNPVEESVRDVDLMPTTRRVAGEYAPILLPARYDKITPEESTLYFLMGTWNPYQVVLMRMQVQRTWSLETRFERLVAALRGGDLAAYVLDGWRARD